MTRQFGTEKCKMRQKCSNCRDVFQETTASYCKRTRNISNPDSPLCRWCKKILRHLYPTENEIRQEERKSLKKKIKENVQFIKNNQDVQKQVEEQTQIQRKIYRNISAKNRSKRIGARVLLPKEEEKLIKKFYLECPLGCHVDHIIPISRGGKHCLINLQYLPSRENIQKSDKISPSLVKMIFEKREMSVSYLCEKFHLSFHDASKVLRELERENAT